MKTESRPSRVIRIGLTLFVLLLGVAIGRLSTGPAALQAGSQQKKPKTFLSGGARSIKALNEIHGTLKQIDARVANIEKHIQKQSKK